MGPWTDFGFRGLGRRTLEAPSACSGLSENWVCFLTMTAKCTFRGSENGRSRLEPFYMWEIGDTGSKQAKDENTSEHVKCARVLGGWVIPETWHGRGLVNCLDLRS